MKYTELDERALQKAHNVWKNCLQEPWTDQEDQTEAFNAGTPGAYFLGNEESLCLKATREALWISQKSMAQKLGITQRAYAKLEANELTGAITLKSFIQVAEALDCDVILAIRPKSKKTFSKIIWEKVKMPPFKFTMLVLKNKRSTLLFWEESPRIYTWIPSFENKWDGFKINP